MFTLLDVGEPEDEEWHFSSMSWAVSDGQEVIRGHSSDLLLRARLSPLPPPTADKLGDLI